MICKIRSNIKLTSNLITSNEPIGLYIPFELKSKGEKDIRLEQNLTHKQKMQRDRNLFFAKQVKDSNEIYHETHQEECKGCPYKDICK